MFLFCSLCDSAAPAARVKRTRPFRRPARHNPLYWLGFVGHPSTRSGGGHIMRTIWTALLPIIAVILGSAPAMAQTLRNDDGPAEYPPASYTGRQYVDSRGCVYVRAGFDGAVTWVPRVDRQRRLICGQTPTFATARPAEPPAPTPPRVTEPPRRTATVTTAPAPKTATRPRPTTSAKVQPAPVKMAPAPVKPKSAAPAKAPTATTACPNVSPAAQPYLKPNPRYPVRCGPQAEDPYGGIQHIQGSAVPIAPPPGYRSAFKDDRLNPNRGRGTPEGEAQMAQIWTNTVPRRLVTQSASRGTKVVIAGKTPTPATTAPAAQGAAYVQVGTFAVPANARNAARALQANGLPVRVGKTRLRGKPVQIVMAGPFASDAEIAAALKLARRAGFADAFARR
ncbi:SPOR domain-containing protein [Meinhardsimonia xiamenensis]|nr:SPOR domain-containing protein [Meinhardsimonia xiamenensis]